MNSNQAQDFLQKFWQAGTVTQQRAVAGAYQVHYRTLPAEEKRRADEVMRVLWPQIDGEVAELERLTQLAQQQLNKTTDRA